MSDKRETRLSFILAAPLFMYAFYILLWWGNWAGMAISVLSFTLVSFIPFSILYPKLPGYLNRKRFIQALEYVSGVLWLRYTFGRRQFKVNQSIEPIKAWRWAYLNRPGKLPRFKSLGNGSFENEAEAMCIMGSNWRNPGHLAPVLNCSCGFYSVRDLLDLSRHHFFLGASDQVILEVELYGKVIEHDLGYRAQYQRVMKVYFAKLCIICKGEADYVSSGVLFCEKCTDRREAVGFREPTETLAEFLDRQASQLGTEVAWMPPDMVKQLTV